MVRWNFPSEWKVAIQNIDCRREEELHSWPKKDRRKEVENEDEVITNNSRI